MRDGEEKMSIDNSTLVKYIKGMKTKPNRGGYFFETITFCINNEKKIREFVENLGKKNTFSEKKEIFYFWMYSDLSWKEIGKLYGIKESTAAQHITHILMCITLKFEKEI